jgi:hypothetical protein
LVCLQATIKRIALRALEQFLCEAVKTSLLNRAMDSCRLARRRIAWHQFSTCTRLNFRRSAEREKKGDTAMCAEP